VSNPDVRLYQGVHRTETSHAANTREQIAPKHRTCLTLRRSTVGCVLLYCACHLDFASGRVLLIRPSPSPPLKSRQSVRAQTPNNVRHVIHVAAATLPSPVTFFEPCHWRRLQFAFAISLRCGSQGMLLLRASHRFRISQRDDFVYPWHTSAMARHYGGCVCAHTW